METEGRVLIVRRIHVTYRLRLKPGERGTAERVHRIHADSCPVARSIKGCVQITTSLEMENLADE